MTATIATVASEFEKFAPGLEEDFTNYVTKGLEKLLKDYPGREQRKLFSCWSSDGNFYRLFSRHLTRADGSNSFADPCDAIKHESVEAEAKRYAREQIDAFVMKLNRKLGGMTNVVVKVVRFGTSFTCTITGELKGKKVVVDQKRIINFSVKGKPFHQWPALITVDGKKTSEAALKKI